MIVNVTKNWFFQQAEKINSKTKTDLEFFMVVKGNPLQNSINIDSKILPWNCSFIFQFPNEFLLLSLLFWETETSYCEYTIDEKLV